MSNYQRIFWICLPIFLGGFNTPIGGANSGTGVGAGSKAGAGGGAGGGAGNKRSKRNAAAMAYNLYSERFARASNMAGVRDERQQRPPGSGPPQQGRQPQNENIQNQQGQEQH